MATYANLFVDQGSDFQTTITLEEPSGDVINVANINFDGQIRRTPGSDQAFDFEIIKPEGEPGSITIRLSSSVTESMGSGRYVYDIFATDEGFGNKFKVLQGILEVIPQVTRV